MNAARAILLALLVSWVFPALAAVAVPPLTGRVVDQTGTLSSGEIASLTQTLKDFEARKGSQIAVLMVPTTGEETIEQFSIRVAEAWKIGRKKIDDGALLVIARNDRHLRIEVGYGVEGALTDATTRRIIDEIITPKFKTGDFAGGIRAGIERMISVIDGEKLPAPEPAHWPAPGTPENGTDPFVIFGLMALAIILRGALGRFAGALATGLSVGVVAWLVAGLLAASVALGVIAFAVTLLVPTVIPTGPTVGGGRHHRSGGWVVGSGSGGSWSSGSSSSGGDSGGFSGGGGSFGGGGASGSW
jgi:uncharacterized protein